MRIELMFVISIFGLHMNYYFNSSASPGCFKCFYGFFYGEMMGYQWLHINLSACNHSKSQRITTIDSLKYYNIFLC